MAARWQRELPHVAKFVLKSQPPSCHQALGSTSCQCRERYSVSVVCVGVMALSCPRLSLKKKLKLSLINLQ